MKTLSAALDRSRKRCSELANDSRDQAASEYKSSSDNLPHCSTCSKRGELRCTAEGVLLLEFHIVAAVFAELIALHVSLQHERFLKFFAAAENATLQ
jgi:hypothetical protein